MPDFLADNWLIILVVFLVVDMPLLFGVLYFFARRRACAAENWIMTLGEIVTSEAQVRKSRRRNEFYSPSIVYEYEVMDQVYRGERLHFGLDNATAMRAWVEEKIAAYLVGRRVEVYYNPDNPSEAALEKAAPIDKSLRMVIVFSILGSLFAAAMLLVMMTLLGTPS